MSNQIILTEEGKIKLEAELKELKEVRRPDIIGKIEQAKEMGDLSENAEYHDAKDQQGLLEARVAEIEGILKKAIIAGKTIDDGLINMGTKFSVKDKNGNIRELAIVGYNEADPMAGKISNESPMGKAFFNRKAGDRVEVEAPSGTIVFDVMEIL
ncbi:MAG: transcription elongation factor GreA [Patescibacteria group bacterium]